LGFEIYQVISQATMAHATVKETVIVGMAFAIIILL
jgi:hypothetical protein